MRCSTTSTSGSFDFSTKYKVKGVERVGRVSIVCITNKSTLALDAWVIRWRPTHASAAASPAAAAIVGKLEDESGDVLVDDIVRHQSKGAMWRFRLPGFGAKEWESLTFESVGDCAVFRSAVRKLEDEGAWMKQRKLSVQEAASRGELKLGEAEAVHELTRLRFPAVDFWTMRSDSDGRSPNTAVAAVVTQAVATGVEAPLHERYLLRPPNGGRLEFGDRMNVGTSDGRYTVRVTDVVWSACLDADIDLERRWRRMRGSDGDVIALKEQYGTELGRAKKAAYDARTASEIARTRRGGGQVAEDPLAVACERRRLATLAPGADIYSTATEGRHAAELLGVPIPTMEPPPPSHDSGEGGGRSRHAALFNRHSQSALYSDWRAHNDAVLRATNAAELEAADSRSARSRAELDLSSYPASVASATKAHARAREDLDACNADLDEAQRKVREGTEAKATANVLAQLKHKEGVAQSSVDAAAKVQRTKAKAKAALDAELPQLERAKAAASARVEAAEIIVARRERARDSCEKVEEGRWRCCEPARAADAASRVHLVPLSKTTEEIFAFISGALAVSRADESDERGVKRKRNGDSALAPQRPQLPKLVPVERTVEGAPDAEARHGRAVAAARTRDEQRVVHELDEKRMYFDDEGRAIVRAAEGRVQEAGVVGVLKINLSKAKRKSKAKVAAKAKKEKEEVEWLGCDACSQWRGKPRNVKAPSGDWVCSDSTWGLTCKTTEAAASALYFAAHKKLDEEEAAARAAAESAAARDEAETNAAASAAAAENEAAARRKRVKIEVAPPQASAFVAAWTLPPSATGTVSRSDATVLASAFGRAANALPADNSYLSPSTTGVATRVASSLSRSSSPVPISLTLPTAGRGTAALHGGRGLGGAGEDAVATAASLLEKFWVASPSKKKRSLRVQFRAVMEVLRCVYTAKQTAATTGHVVDANIADAEAARVLKESRFKRLNALLKVRECGKLRMLAANCYHPSALTTSSLTTTTSRVPDTPFLTHTHIRTQWRPSAWRARPGDTRATAISPSRCTCCATI